jgi:hypothetical protein
VKLQERNFAAVNSTDGEELASVDGGFYMVVILAAEAMYPARSGQKMLGREMALVQVVRSLTEDCKPGPIQDSASFLTKELHFIEIKNHKKKNLKSQNI